MPHASRCSTALPRSWSDRDGEVAIDGCAEARRAVIGYCFDTDIISATIKPAPPLHLLRRLAVVPPQQQFTTAVTVGELIYGARRVGRGELSARVERAVRKAQTVLPFDTLAARVFGELKAVLERRGTPLAEPDLRIASIAVARDLVLVTRNVRHFRRISGLTVENWIDEGPDGPLE